MNIQHFIIIRKLLLYLKDQYPNERMKELDSSYQKLLTKGELLDIIRIMTGGGSHPDDPDFEVLTGSELLEWIKDEYYILDYIIQEIEQEIGI